MSAHPRFELSFKFVVEGSEAVNAMQWPLTILLLAIAVGLLIAAFRARPIKWAKRS